MSKPKTQKNSQIPTLMLLSLNPINPCCATSLRIRRKSWPAEARLQTASGKNKRSNGEKKRSMRTPMHLLMGEMRRSIMGLVVVRINVVSSNQ